MDFIQMGPEIINLEFNNQQYIPRTGTPLFRIANALQTKTDTNPTRRLIQIHSLETCVCFFFERRHALTVTRQLAAYGVEHPAYITGILNGTKHSMEIPKHCVVGVAVAIFTCLFETSA